MMSRKQVRTPLSFKLCIFLKTHFFRDGTFPSFFWEMFWPICCSKLILQQCLDPLWRWSPWHFFGTQLGLVFLDAGNPTRLLSFHGFSFSKKKRFSPCKPPTPRKFLVAKIFFLEGKSHDLVPHRCCFHFLLRSTTFPFSHHQSSPTQKKSSADGFSHTQQG